MTSMPNRRRSSFAVLSKLETLKHSPAQILPRTIDTGRAETNKKDLIIETGLDERMQKTEKKETLELYKDRNTQVLLSKFLSGEIKTLEPVYNQETGYRYPVVEAIVGDAAQAEKFLGRLSDSGILERTLYDKVLLCPKCESTNISFRYCCPFCKSFDIQKSSLVEHVKCGYMDLEANFRQGTKYVCPKCHEEMRAIDVDYRKAGVWCTCKFCGKSFDIPVSEHFCRNCRGTSTFEEASIKEVYSYTLGERARTECSQSWFLIAPIREFLVEEGLTVESPALLKGKSGANHSFDIAAYKRGASKKVTVIDLAMSAESAVSEQPVIALFAKIFDVSPEKAFLIAIPRLNENGKRMAELYSIYAIEAEDQAKAVKALRQYL
jgi:transcription elongation factor Elf1